MRGEFSGVWSETWSAIWLPLAGQELAPPDMFCELYRELANAFFEPPSVEALADVIDNPEQSSKAFEFSAMQVFQRKGVSPIS
jgi:hypothetical protein